MLETDVSNYKKINELLNKQEYTNKFIVGVRSSLIRDWQVLGLLEARSGNWSRYSLIEILWMSIIIELRTIGYSNSKLLLIRNYLFEDTSLSAQRNEFNNISVATIEAIVYGTPIVLVINNDGQSALLKDYEYVSALQNDGLNAHSVLSINQQIKSYISVLYEAPDTSEFSGLSRDELQVLLILRSENYLSVKITKKNGLIDIIEGTERVNAKDKIVDILKQYKYQNIEIIKTNGKIVDISRTIKTKSTNSN